MKNNYVIWATKNEEGACVLDGLQGVDKVIKLNQGESQIGKVSNNVVYTMDLNYPTDTLLVDNLGNTDLLIVVSSKFKEFLESRNLKNVEYLPVTINNHKGRAASKDYYIIHPVEPVDCLDLEESRAEMDFIAKSEVSSVEKVVLDDTRVDCERELFKLSSFYEVTLVKRELSLAIDEMGFTGIRWLEMGDYPEI